MGGVSKNMTASPKTKVRPLPFSRVGDPAKRVIRNPPTLRRPSSFSPLRNLARSRVTNNAECRRRRARARARPGAERARDQGSSRVPRSAPSVSPSPRRATTRASPSSLFPPASDALPPASGKATTNLGTGDARARGDVRAPRRASARARGFWVPEPTRAKHPRGRGRVDRPGAARPRPVGARAQVAAKYPRGGRPSWNPGAPELEPGPRPRRAAESFAAARAGGGDEPGAPSGSGETVRFRRANARARGRTVRSRVAVVQPLRPHQRQPRVPARQIFLRAASAPSPSRLFRKTAPRRPRRRRGRVPGDAPAAQRGAPARVRGRALAGRRRGERGSGERGSGDGSRRTGTGTGTGTRVVRSRVPSPGFYVELADSPRTPPSTPPSPVREQPPREPPPPKREPPPPRRPSQSPRTSPPLWTRFLGRFRGARRGTPAPWYTRLRARPSHARRAISPRRRAARSRTTCSAECKR